jgi:TonB family protein
MVLDLVDQSREVVFPSAAGRPSPLLLAAPRIPYASMGLSLLFHGLVLMIFIFSPLKGRARSVIDLEHEKVTFYRLSEGFPDISPLFREPPKPPQKPGDDPKPDQVPPFRSESEIAINPKETLPSSQVLDQPDFPRVASLPKLELPNILLTRPKAEPGEEPVSVSEKIDRDINQELRQRMSQVSTGARLELKISDPLPMQQSPDLGDLPLQNRSMAFTGAPDLSLPAPIEPSVVSPQVSQLNTRLKSFGQRSLLVAPPVDDPKVNGEVGQLPTGTNALIYSSDPKLPKGELRIPKASSLGSINASPQGGTGRGAGTGSPEFGNASITIPGVSIKNKIPAVPSVNGVGVVQAPKPLPPPLEQSKTEQKPQLATPKTLSLPLHSALNIPSFNDPRASLPAQSPLEEVERQGIEIYTTSINAPNFTSKRGSWIFRFAEVAQTISSSKTDSAPQDERSREGRLTAPVATVKVDPRYPPEVIRERVEGVIVLYAVLRKDGTVDPSSVRLVRKLDSRLEVSAKEALIAWKFKPSQKNGQPVDIQAEITIPFYFRKDPLYQ